MLHRCDEIFHRLEQIDKHERESVVLGFVLLFGRWLRAEAVTGIAGLVVVAAHHVGDAARKATDKVQNGAALVAETGHIVHE